MESIDASQPRQTKTKPAAAALSQRSVSGQALTIKPSAAVKQVAINKRFLLLVSGWDVIGLNVVFFDKLGFVLIA
jgi:hypothetical protein